MLDSSIGCLYCNKVLDSHITICKSVDLMKAHVKKDHPSKPQI